MGKNKHLRRLLPILGALAAVGATAYAAHKHGQAAGFKLGESVSHTNARDEYMRNGYTLAYDEAKNIAQREANDAYAGRIKDLTSRIGAMGSMDAVGDVFFD